jgi:hypothetical protein
MAVYEYVEPTTAELDRLLWGLVPVVAEQAGITHADALTHLRRVWVDHLKSAKASDGADYAYDGRVASWRVRLIIWRTDQHDQPAERLADTDPRAEFSPSSIAPGETVLFGLPAVAAWSLDMITQAHPAPATLEGVDAVTLAAKLKSLRVTLSKSGGKTVWRLRYSVATPRTERPDGPPTLRHLAGSAPALQHFCAYVYVQREERPRGAR